MIRSALIAVAVLAAVGTPSSALTITQTQGFGGRPNFDTTVQFDLFDPSRGALQSVEWQFELQIEGGSLTVDNDGVLPVDVLVELGATASMLSTDVTLLDSGFTSILSGAGEIAVSTGSELNLEGDNGDGMTFDPTMPDADTHDGGTATVSGGSFVNEQFLTDYVGTTMFDLDVDIDQLINFGGSGGVSGQFDPVTAFANITLTYEYVPEPSSLTLCVLALLGLTSFARPRRGNMR